MDLPVLGTHPVPARSIWRMIGFPQATPYPSENHGARRNCAAPDLLVLHYTAMETAKEALERLCNFDHEVSAHYLISASGEVFQLVSEDRRAWHAGRSYWAGHRDVNSDRLALSLITMAAFHFPFHNSLLWLGSAMIFSSVGLFPSGASSRIQTSPLVANWIPGSDLIGPAWPKKISEAGLD